MSDLISRQKVLRCIKESADDIDWGQSEDGDAFKHYVGALYRTVACKEIFPSEEPERKKGKWIEYPDCLGYDGAYSDDDIVCSVCGHVYNICDNCTEEFDFCPHCGADMRGE